MRICLIIVGLLLQGTVWAQNGLMGIWVLQKKEHVTGPDYANAIPKQVKLHIVSDSLIMESLYEDEGNAVSNRQALVMSGQPVSNVGSRTNRKYSKSLKWNAGKTGYVLTIVIHLPGNPNEVDFTRVETWNLSPDNKNLTLNKRSIETRSENWETNGMYVRVP